MVARKSLLDPVSPTRVDSADRTTHAAPFGIFLRGAFTAPTLLQPALFEKGPQLFFGDLDLERLELLRP